MITRSVVYSIFVFACALLTACAGRTASLAPAGITDSLDMASPPVTPKQFGTARQPSSVEQTTNTAQILLPTATPTAVLSATPTEAVAPVKVQAGPQFAVGNDLTIAALRARQIEGSDIVIEQTLANEANYAQYIASYVSEGYKIYGLLTVPLGDVPQGGFKAIVFNHGYIPPAAYRTTERYVAYVDALARNGFVVFKIDLRGFGRSEGEPTGAYFSPGYTIDALSALKSLQKLEYVDAEGIGMWGHSMAGNLVLRAMLVGGPLGADVQAGVIWAGAVYSYDDMVRYAIDDPSFRREEQPATMRPGTLLRETYGRPDTDVRFWQAVSLTANIEYLEAPLQIHHAQNDDVVNVGYSQDLAAVLVAANKPHEFYQYDGGGHNLNSPYFSDAMQRTIEFFRTNL